MDLVTFFCSDNQISNLDLTNNGILNWFYCDNNQLTSLDFSKNLELSELNCANNKLQSLDFSANIALGYLECTNNKLTNLNLSKNNLLHYLNCEYNFLTNLDVSNNLNLESFFISDNPLTIIDISKNINIQLFFAYSISNLTVCVNKQQDTTSTAWFIDHTSNYSTTCASELGVDENFSNAKYKIVKAYNLQGIEVPINTQNELIILLYSNGFSQKVINQ